MFISKKHKIIGTYKVNMCKLKYNTNKVKCINVNNEQTTFSIQVLPYIHPLEYLYISPLLEITPFDSVIKFNDKVIVIKHNILQINKYVKNIYQ